MFSNFGKESEAIDEYLEIVKMTFESEDQCYTFYNSYAAKKGFSVRKDIVRREKKVGDIFYMAASRSESQHGHRNNGPPSVHRPPHHSRYFFQLCKMNPIILVIFVGHNGCKKFEMRG